MVPDRSAEAYPVRGLILETPENGFPRIGPPKTSDLRGHVAGAGGELPKIQSSRLAVWWAGRLANKPASRLVH